MSDNASSSKPLATVPEDQATASTSSSLPPAAKAAAEAAVKTAISETLDAEEGEIDESKGSEVNGDAGGLRTVFSDPKNFNVVHPLYSKW